LPKRTVRISTEGSPDGFASVADDESLGEGETLRAEIDGTVVTLVRLQGDVFCFGEFCTHRFGPMSEASFSDCEGECPWHRSRFDVRSGEATSGPAKEALLTYPVKVEAGQIRVRPVPVGPAGAPARGEARSD
jgi:nitrite reductase/ring-hydroxylating ferredoxin subunit